MTMTVTMTMTMTNTFRQHPISGFVKKSYFEPEINLIFSGFIQIFHILDLLNFFIFCELAMCLLLSGFVEIFGTKTFTFTL